MNKEILRLAIPNIISNISIPLLSTVDTALMGRFSELHLGAVGIGALLFNFLYWNLGFLRMGTTGITAQAFGANDQSKSIHTLLRALAIAIGLGLLLLLLQLPLQQLGFSALGVTSENHYLVSEYFYIRIWAAPAALALVTINGWCFGMQNAIFPLVFTVFANAVNIALSFYLVRVLNWEIAGVAWATVCAQYGSLLLAILMIHYKYKNLKAYFDRSVFWIKKELSEFFTVNRDIFIRTLFLTGAFAFFYRQSSFSGPTILAVNVILMQFLNWMSYGIDGFAYASESLVGKYKGAKNDGMLSKAIRLSFVWAMALAALYALVYGLAGEMLLRIFTDQENVIQAALPFMIWMMILPLTATPSYLWDGIYIGLTASKAMRNSMALSFVFFIICWFFTQHLGNHGLWLSLIVLMMARGIIQGFLYFKKGHQLV